MWVCVMQKEKKKRESYRKRETGRGNYNREEKIRSKNRFWWYGHRQPNQPSLHVWYPETSRRRLCRFVTSQTESLFQLCAESHAICDKNVYLCVRLDIIKPFHGCSLCSLYGADIPAASFIFSWLKLFTLENILIGSENIFCKGAFVLTKKAWIHGQAICCLLSFTGLLIKRLLASAGCCSQHSSALWSRCASAKTVLWNDNPPSCLGCQPTTLLNWFSKIREWMSVFSSRPFSLRRTMTIGTGIFLLFRSFVDCFEKCRLRRSVSWWWLKSRDGRGGKESQSCFCLFVSVCLKAERTLYSVLGLTLS